MLTSRDKIMLLQPISQNSKEIVSPVVPSVIMLSPGYKYKNTVISKVPDNERLVCLLLFCVSLEALEEDNLYEDMDDFLV
jgi:hypothetical protein